MSTFIFSFKIKVRFNPLKKTRKGGYFSYLNTPFILLDYLFVAVGVHVDVNIYLFFQNKVKFIP
jgi:hypothetical protein